MKNNLSRLTQASIIGLSDCEVFLPLILLKVFYP